MAGGGSGVGAGRRGGRGNSSGGDGGGGGGGGGGRGGRIQEHHQNQQHQQHPQQQVHHQNGPGTTVQCGPNQYRLGLYGWRRRCLYGLVLLLLVMVILNLALTLFILRVLDFTTEGIGGLQIVRGGMIASGEVHVMERLVAARISTPPHVPIRILAAENFSISATNKDGRSNRIFMNSEAMQCTSDQLVIRDKQGRLLFSATQDEVLVGARHLTVKGEGGAVFSGSVQTAHVTAPVKESLLLESLTRSLEITAPQGVALESRAGTISARCLHDFILQSRGGMIKFDTPNIFIQGLRTSTLQTNDQRPARPDVYQASPCTH
ncbi:hypothetical protein O3P69_003234 [Scylla paramamosain]|uniref:Delta-sarcoglycan n=1 Tax=Scylla paramamosain TaxID=85552 RepID=A0AAW0UNG2_SCYPA